ALTGRRKDSVQHGRSGDEDCRLTDAAPEAPRRHDNALHLRHVADAHRVVAIEIGLLDGALFNRALLIEQRGEPIDEGAGDLPLDLRRVDRMARIGGRYEAVDLDFTLMKR